jgi:CelD/BcsL family acetyltransferase involved in cellulose biosynthesis
MSAQTAATGERPAHLALVEPIPGLRIERLASVDDLDRVREEWDDFVERSGSDIYFTVDWLQAWWTHYGRGRTFMGLIARDGDRMVAALPFCVARLWAGPVPVRLARFVGADSTLPVFTPAIAAGFEEAVLRAAVERLLGDAGCDAVSLSPLSGESPVAAAAARVAGAEHLALVRADSPGPHTLFRLPGSFEDYLAGLGKSQRRDHGRFLRQLHKRQAITYRTVSGDEAIAAFDGFLELHAAHWQAQGKLGHFGDWPASEDFNRELLARMAASGRARFYEIAGDGQVLAMEYSFVLGERCYWRLPARDLDPELQKLRLGRLSLAEMFRVLIEDGRTLVEAGPGHYEYKLRLGAEEHPLRRVVISGRSVSSRWRAALLLRWADLLHLVYYRGWFLKLAPRLRVKRRPLWRPWIRTRV